MERYIKVTKERYYDCITNTFIRTNKRMRGSIPKKLYNFNPLFKDSVIFNNLNLSRQQLILSVTEHCNLRCQYCIYCDSKFQKTAELKKMNFDVAKKAIDDYLKNSTFSQRRCISFYGGESLLNFELIKDCVDYVESMNLTSDVTFLLTTNGTLLNKKIAQFLYNHRFLVNISMDGPQHIHDRYRKTRIGDATFHKVITSTKELIDLDPDYWKDALSLLCVMAPPIDYNLVIDYFELLPFKYTMSDLEMTDSMKQVVQKSMSNDDESQVIHLGNKDRASTGLVVEMRTTKEILQQASFTPFVPGRYCLPGLKRTFVATNGDYYICEKDDQNDEHIIGNVETGMDYQKILEMRDKVYRFHKENCQTCWAARFCGMCFATLDNFPKCCEDFKHNTLQAMKCIVEEEVYV